MSSHSVCTWVSTGWKHLVQVAGGPGLAGASCSSPHLPGGPGSRPRQEGSLKMPRAAHPHGPPTPCRAGHGNTVPKPSSLADSPKEGQPQAGVCPQHSPLPQHCLPEPSCPPFPSPLGADSRHGCLVCTIPPHGTGRGLAPSGQSPGQPCPARPEPAGSLGVYAGREQLWRSPEQVQLMDTAKDQRGRH